MENILPKHGIISNEIILNNNILQPRAIGRNYFFINEIKNIYNLNVTPNLTEETFVYVLSFGGGLFGNVDGNGVLTSGDVQLNWTNSSIANNNMPKVVIKTLRGTTNEPSMSDGGKTMENTGDVTYIGSLCPSSFLTIVLLINDFGNFTSDGINNSLDYIKTTPNYPNKIIGVSCSWAASEYEIITYRPQSILDNFETLSSDFKNNGIHIAIASGDNGSKEINLPYPNCGYPQTSTNVISCGGTKLICPSNVYNDVLTSETGWSGSGGGLSLYYPSPYYQSSFGYNKRSIPDISLISDPSNTSGIVLYMQTKVFAIGGTSYVAPIVIGYLAAINKKTCLNDIIYNTNYSNCFHDITVGNNGNYNAGPGYDLVTGMGSLNGANLTTTINIFEGIVYSVTLNETTLNIAPDSNYQLVWTILPYFVVNKDVTFSSDNTNAMTVSNTGLITAKLSGSANITITTVNSGKTDVVAVTIKIPVTGVTISPKTITINAGETTTFTSIVSPVNATNKGVSYGSEQPSIVSIDVNTGVATGISGGTTIISVYTDEPNHTDNATITVIEIIPTSITLNSSSFNMAVGSTFQLVANILPTNATNKNVTWSSSNTSVATVSNTGIVTAVSLGTSTITATTVSGGLSTTATANVNTISVTSITLNADTLNLIVGDIYQLIGTILPQNATNQNITWSKNNNNIDLSNSGKVTALTIGTSIVTSTTVDGSKIDTCNINISKIDVTSVTISPGSKSLFVGETFELTATILPNNASNKNVTWTKSNNGVINISNSGVITAIGVGTSVVTVTTADQLKTSICNVTVAFMNVSSVSLNATSRSMQTGDTFQLVASILPTNASNKNITWSSDKANIASVSNSGLVSGLTVGSANITVRTVNQSRTAICKFTITPILVKSVSLNASSATILIGQTFQFVATVSPTNASNKTVKWSKNNANVSISTSGLVNGLKVGTSTITVTTNDQKKTATAIVTVNPIPVRSVSLNITTATIKKGKTITLKATVSPTNATIKTVTWRTSNANIATISTKGVVKGINPGSAIITVTTTNGGYIATCNVTVTL